MKRCTCHCNCGLEKTSERFCADCEHLASQFPDFVFHNPPTGNSSIAYNAKRPMTPEEQAISDDLADILS